MAASAATAGPAAAAAGAEVERLDIAARPDAGARLEGVGLSFHNWDDYWKEDACYRFSAAEVDLLEAATEELHAMCREAIDRVLRQGRLDELGLPEAFWAPVAASWGRGDFSLYGRFDLAYDGFHPPKLLEYNADTPTSLLESAVAQWYWLQDVRPAADQFNSLHERLVARWAALPAGCNLHFASLADNEEDWVCITYLRDTATQAGRTTRHVAVEDLGWNATQARFVDEGGAPIAQLFKLYPWEWLMREPFGAHIAGGGTTFIEPMWKAMLSSKGLLPLLWEYFPQHPNLLPAARTPDGLGGAWARKPLFSREGANVQLVRDGAVIAEDDGPYGAEGCIYQALHPLPNFGGRYPVLGSWVVGDDAAGLCVREDRSLITTNMSHFVPHYFD